MKRVGILSDKYWEENCLEFQPMHIGLAQRLYPYEVSPLQGVPVPSVKPTAQRGYNLVNLATKLSNTLNVPYEQALDRLVQHSKEMSFPKPNQVVPNVSFGGGKRDQPSLLAVQMKPRESDFSQLNRAIEKPVKTDPPPPSPTAMVGRDTGQYMPKTGRVDPDSIMDPLKDEI